MTTATATRFCPLPHHVEPERPRLASDFAVMCSGHVKQGSTALCELTVRYEQLLAHVEPERLDQAAALRDEIRNYLLHNADNVAAVLRDGGPYEPEVPRVIGYLLTSHAWIVQQEWSPRYVEHLRSLTWRSWRLLHPYRGAHGLPLPCPNPACSGSTVPAPGALPPYRRLYADTLLPQRGAMVCDTCGCDVPTGLWRNVARRIAREVAA